MSPTELKELVEQRRSIIFHSCWLCGKPFIDDNPEWWMDADRVCEITEEAPPEIGDRFYCCCEKHWNEAHEALGFYALATADSSQIQLRGDTDDGVYGSELQDEEGIEGISHYW